MGLVQLWLSPKKKEVAGFFLHSVFSLLLSRSCHACLFASMPLIILTIRQARSANNFHCVASRQWGRACWWWRCIISFFLERLSTSHSFFVVGLEEDQPSFRIDCCRLICFTKVSATSSPASSTDLRAFLPDHTLSNLPKELGTRRARLSWHAARNSS